MTKRKARRSDVDHLSADESGRPLMLQPAVFWRWVVVDLITNVLEYEGFDDADDLMERALSRIQTGEILSVETISEGAGREVVSEYEALAWNSGVLRPELDPEEAEEAFNPLIRRWRDHHGDPLHESCPACGRLVIVESEGEVVSMTHEEPSCQAFDMVMARIGVASKEGPARKKYEKNAN